MSDLKQHLIKLGADHRDLRPHIRPILAELDKASSAPVIEDFSPSSSSTVEWLEDGSIVWRDEAQEIVYRSKREALRDLQAMLATESGEWWADDLRDAIKWIKRNVH